MMAVKTAARLAGADAEVPHELHPAISMTSLKTKLTDSVPIILARLLLGHHYAPGKKKAVRGRALEDDAMPGLKMSRASDVSD